MNILLVGYGKMGKTIEKVALARGHRIAGRIDIDNAHELDTISADVAIEFSNPEAAYDNVKKCIERQLAVVCGTTGWLERKNELDQLSRDRGSAFFYASNYSLGVNIFFHLNRQLARMMNGFPDYQVIIDETHHIHKKDAPSGTAITLAEGVIENLQRKRSWVNTNSAKADELVVRSFREGEVPGTHIVRYQSTVDDIEIRHTAHTREGFALGAVMVAEWIKGRKGPLNMDDFLKF